MRGKRLEIQEGNEAAPAEFVGDLRFRTLLGEQDWARLPFEVRKRFSKRVRPGESVVYVGEIREFRVSTAGWLLAQCLRLIGAPLPLDPSAHAASVVTVTEDSRSNGQFWTRLFARGRGFPQIIQSSKRFAGPTGLEEAIGYGIVMSLNVTVEDEALFFCSQGYALQIAGHRLRLPRWLTPGELTVSHRGLTPDTFLFAMRLTHPRLGELIYQDAVYRDPPP